MNAPAIIRLSSPADTVASIPYILGFQPVNSVVALWLRNGSMLCAQRCDAADSFDHPDVFTQFVKRHHPTDAILLFYGDFEQDAMDSFTAYLEADLTVRDSITVKDGRWRSLKCNDPVCCPPEGSPIDGSPTIAAEFVGAGIAPAASREEVEDRMRPQGKQGYCITAPPRDREPDRDQAIERILKFLIDCGGVRPSETFAWLQDIRVRDTVMYDAVVSFDADEMRAAITTMETVVRGMHPDDAPPALTVLAFFAYVTGNGAQAEMAVSIALDIDEDYTLAQMLRDMIQKAIPPTLLAQSMVQIGRNKVRYGL